MALGTNDDGFTLISDNGIVYHSIQNTKNIPNFLTTYPLEDSQQKNQDIYNQSFSAERYGNELRWIFETFGEDENLFRKHILTKLNIQPGQRILITGCGLGGDVGAVAEAVGAKGEVYAQDLAPEMIIAAAKRVKELSFNTENVHFSICDAQSLPFLDGFFDGVFHFGGINLFADIGMAIGEMARVVRSGGHVVFGDESVGPWLRETDYGRAAICNNALWKAHPPIHLLPTKAVNVEMQWILGNCFYLISFQMTEDGPFMDMDVPHIGARGGSMRTRYFGRLEGVSVKSKNFVLEDAKKLGVSVAEWLESAIKEKGKN